MRNLKYVFKDALADEFSANLDTEYVEARLVFGVKIIKERETDEVEIYNTARGGDYYQEISLKEYKNFVEKGWRYGVYVISLSNYRRKLEAIDKTIQRYISEGASKTNLSQAQDRRVRIMNRYSKISNKLNLLN
jgi:hypothetical protein|tara:strand:+ start:658 stop:1059 length:402 start_codon:yes stop_codon:yes gene_type:complete